MSDSVPGQRVCNLWLLTEDRYAALLAAEARLAAVEQAARVWVDGGHFCMMECPTCQAVVDALAAPLEETGAADAAV